ncbi:MAG: 2-amino-4-hydroxy-6-hydroxymethyldihydropteridine diphosphokinase [Bacteroidota bacterium]
MDEVFILLGSNQGDRLDYITRAMAMISERAGQIVKKSALYETEPWGFEDPTSFLNQVVEISTGLKPAELLDQLLTIEARLGRIRPFDSCGCAVPSGYAGRTIDLDILFFGQKLVFTENLMIPHPRLHERRFSLVPMNEIAPGFTHPLLKKSISILLQECPDRAAVVLVE